MTNDFNQGGGGWQFAINRPHDWVWANTFTADECDRIIELADCNMVDGPIDGRVSYVRQSSVRFLHPSSVTQWIFQRITDIVIKTNYEYFGFDLTGMVEGLQFTRYDSPDGHYGWHCDMGPDSVPRKLSLTIQLSDPDSYIGGDLQLSPGGSIVEAQVAGRERGRAFLFPSWMPHRVTPVTEGTRYSLVAWVTGPPFR